MRVKKRRFKTEGYEHIYCRSANKAILFFDDIDRLAYYTAFSSRARKTGVVVLGLSIMFDHVHHLSAFTTADGMSSFMRDHLSFFALEYNEDMGKHGPVFEKAYGNAPKCGDKKIRTAIAYVANNHTEKKLCARVEECRWNFVAYLGSDYPYSERIQLDKASRKLRRSIAAVRSCDGPIGYRRLRNMFDGLNEKEKEQLTDFIITHYYPIDREAVLSFYGGDYQTMLTALNSNTGNEYDIQEDFDPDSHQIYTKMIDICKRSSYEHNLKRMQVATHTQKRFIADTLQKLTGATARQLQKFLALN